VRAFSSELTICERKKERYPSGSELEVNLSSLLQKRNKAYKDDAPIPIVEESSF